MHLYVQAPFWSAVVAESTVSSSTYKNTTYMDHVLFYNKKVKKIVKTNPELAHFPFQKGFISSCLAEHGEVGKAKFT
jgi:hypothetical protein